MHLDPYFHSYFFSHLANSGYGINLMLFMIIQDIQIRGVNRDEKSIKMAKQFPNSRHFLTYRHSLRVLQFLFLLAQIGDVFSCLLTNLFN